jgi:hypothetical protein
VNPSYETLTAPSSPNKEKDSPEPTTAAVIEARNQEMLRVTPKLRVLIGDRDGLGDLLGLMVARTVSAGAVTDNVRVKGSLIAPSLSIT